MMHRHVLSIPWVKEIEFPFFHVIPKPEGEKYSLGEKMMLIINGICHTVTVESRKERAEVVEFIFSPQ